MRPCTYGTAAGRVAWTSVTFYSIDLPGICVACLGSVEQPAYSSPSAFISSARGLAIFDQLTGSIEYCSSSGLPSPSVYSYSCEFSRCVIG